MSKPVYYLYFVMLKMKCFAFQQGFDISIHYNENNIVGPYFARVSLSPFIRTNDCPD